MINKYEERLGTERMLPLVFKMALPAVAAIIETIKDYTLGYKLPGAGGGGYLYMVAKDPQAAGQIRRILTEHAPNPRARFVDMTLSDKGLQVSRS